MGPGGGGGGGGGAMSVMWWRVGASGRVGLSVGDITEWAGDAVVNAAKETLLGGGGVDGALHVAAGPGLVEECREIPEVRPGVRCQTGAARITGGHALSAAHVIHTWAPCTPRTLRETPGPCCPRATAAACREREGVQVDRLPSDLVRGLQVPRQ